MTVLSGQSIRKRKIFEPFCERSRCELSNMSYGLSAAGYDVRLKLGYIIPPGGFQLASTLEHFTIPNDCIAIVHDKSTLARLGLALQNTVAEPGWRGWLTLELTNHGDYPITLYAGQPIAQILFHLTDEPVEQPYEGRYQDQADEAVSAKFLIGTEEKF